MPALESALAGSGAVLPVPADDDRETLLLTSALRAGEHIADDVAVVVSTSGTTGVPKGAMLSAAALTASASATHARLGGPGRWLLALPAYHVAGLQVLVRSAVAGTTPVALSPSFGVAEIPTAVRRLGAGRRYASLVAVQLDKALRDPTAARGARRARRRVDRRWTDARRHRRKGGRVGHFGRPDLRDE